MKHMDYSVNSQRLEAHTIAPEAPGGKTEQVTDVSRMQKGNAHGGGDERLLSDFWALLDGEDPSICCTNRFYDANGKCQLPEKI